MNSQAEYDAYQAGFQDDPKIVKTRKDHKCTECGVIIPKGSLAAYQEGKSPVYETDESHGDIWGEGPQIGIEYWKAWFHEDPSVCEKNNQGDSI